jgi:CheY-like chemotaxis protein
MSGGESYNVKLPLLLDGINILVAEDNILNQKIANFILKKQGAAVHTVLNGKEAIDLLSQANEFDIVLMDIQMPGMDGFKATKYIRKDLKNNIPIIGLTADLVAAATEECTEAGMNACVCKPFDPTSLCHLILSVIKEGKN